jgi:hypothetical protein
MRPAFYLAAQEADGSETRINAALKSCAPATNAKNIIFSLFRRQSLNNNAIRSHLYLD